VDDFEIQIEQAMQADRFRLRRQWRAIAALSDSSPRKLADIDRLKNALNQSIERRQARSQVNVPLNYDPELPITAHREEIIRLIHDRQVIIVCGETGSGKSTQLPKLCLDAGRGRSGMIGHTQPRRLAARSISTRLAEELETQVGQLVGFKIRFTDRTDPLTLVKLMTDGVLLAEIQRDRFLDSYDTIIIDEAHERSLNIDLLIGYLIPLIDRRPELRLIITSATIDADRFAEHFHDALGPAPIVNVSGRTYPVEIRYRDPSARAQEGEISDEAAWIAEMMSAVDELMIEGQGDILVFLPSERDIRDASKHLRGHLTQSGELQRTEVLPLYSRLTEPEQQRIFQPHRGRRIVLATNVAESSLTVPGIRYVIDTGTARISRYAPRSKVQRLPIEAVSQASADQRAGRCGRLGPGICIRLFSEQDYLSRPRYTTPEIKRTNLASAILQARMLGIGNLDQLPLLDPPRPEMIRDGYATLHELGAIDDRDELTAIGKKLGRWPVDPRVGRMVLEADRNGCLADILIIASALEVQDPRLRPPEKQQAADEAQAKFVDPNSDFLSFLRLWDFYHRLKEELGRSRLERACRDSFLSLPRLREWADIHRQLSELVSQQGLKHGQRVAKLGLVDPSDRDKELAEKERRKKQHKSGQTEPQTEQPAKLPPGYDRIHQSLLAGLLSGIGMLDDERTYKGAASIDFQLWPGSGLRQIRPKWVVVSEIIETHQRYGRTAARIDPLWIETLAKHLLKAHYDQPHFSRNSGSAMIYERKTLFGLPVIPRRRVPLAPIDAQLARKILIDEGIVEQQLVSRANFYRKNCELLEEVREWASRTRRRDLVIDPYFLSQFYHQRIPSSVVDRGSLEAWDRQLKNAPRKKDSQEQSTGETSDTNPELPTVLLTWDDLVPDLDREKLADSFPKSISIGETDLPVSYRFEPGDAKDGVTITVPQAGLSQLDPERLEWLVPGLLEEKILALIKSLPKRLRRNLVPAPDTAKKLADTWSASDTIREPFWPTLCKRLSAIADETIRPADFELDKVPEHLRMRIEVRDESGKPMASSRDLKELLVESKPTAATVTAVATSVEKEPWYREKMTSFDIEEIPASVVVQQRGLSLTLYPTLDDQVEFVKTSVTDCLAAAEKGIRLGVLRLFTFVEHRELKSQVAHLPQISQCQLWLASRFKSETVRHGLELLMARIAFVEDRPTIRSKSDFDLARQSRIARISSAAQEVAKWLPRFAEQFHSTSLLQEKAPSPWRESVGAIRLHLDQLFAGNIFQEVPWQWLREYPRYLQAIGARMERLKTGGVAKDLANEASISNFWKDYQAGLASPLAQSHSAKLEEYRWMIEEFRVSVFAQQLGTKVPVSQKRLEKFASEFET
jgi:ATP-dependent helicase HrpA